jgi:oligoendopeptidase F
MSTTSSTYTQTGWSLKDLAPAGADIRAAEETGIEPIFTEIDQAVTGFEAVRPQLKPDLPSADFLVMVSDLEKIQRQLNRLYSYAELLFSQNTQDQEAQTLLARVEQFAAELANRTLFFELWWKDLDDANAQRLIVSSGDYRYWLEELRHFKPHTLTEPEEKIVNLKNVTGASALNMLYASLTNRYTFQLEVNGEQKTLTRGELMTYVRQPDPDLRARAYQELYRVYGNDGSILGQIYQNLVRDWRNEQMTLRHFESPIAARNLVNDIPDGVVDTLLDVSRQNAGLFQRYFRFKARQLGLPRLRRYDIYAPLAKSEKHYSFNDATALVFDSFREFDPAFAEMAERVFAQNHLDSEVRPGKRSGAFCLTAVPDLTPWVLVSYQGRSDDVSTLAHELGHAIHSMLAAQHSMFTFHASLPLAETASTFGEMLLVDRLLKAESDPAVRRDLIMRQVDDAYATVLRQAYFALFECEAHDLIQHGAAVDELAAAYQKNLEDQFGDAVDVAPEFRWEWVSIPHIYNVPFYVYAYSFGQLLVLSLYQQFRQEGEPFKARYRRILSTGGSAAPAQILRAAGIDIAQPSFWQGGFDVIQGLVGELEKEE